MVIPRAVHMSADKTYVLSLIKAPNDAVQSASAAVIFILRHQIPFVIHLFVLDISYE